MSCKYITHSVLRSSPLPREPWPLLCCTCTCLTQSHTSMQSTPMWISHSCSNIFNSNLRVLHSLCCQKQICVCFSAFVAFLLLCVRLCCFFIWLHVICDTLTQTSTLAGWKLSKACAGMYKVVALRHVRVRQDASTAAGSQLWLCAVGVLHAAGSSCWPRHGPPSCSLM